jgi:phosphoribosyl 1,2-cyclic phosphodiesterase
MPAIHSVMKFTVLGSGSSGNAVLISSEKTKVLIDAGLSAREIVRRLAVVGVDPADLDAIVITHEHSDHIGGPRNLLRIVDCPVYITGDTEEAYYWTRKTNGNGESEALRRRDGLNGRTMEIDSNSDLGTVVDFEPFTVRTMLSITRISLQNATVFVSLPTFDTLPTRSSRSCAVGCDLLLSPITAEICWRLARL